jgi:hypothetical protein
MWAKTMLPVQPMKAHVEGGRLILDEPTNLPDGAEVELIAADQAEFDPDERARLVEAIEEGAADFERGDHVDGFELIEKLRARRAPPIR